MANATSNPYEIAPKLEGGGLPCSHKNHEAIEKGMRSTNTSNTLNSKSTDQSQSSSISKVKERAARVIGALRPNVNPDETKVIISALESHPEGYPRLACYLNSDDSFTMYRRFGILHARLVLQKQDELRELESELFISDAQDEKTAEGRKCLRSREEEDDRDERPQAWRAKKDILKDVQLTLLEYGQILKQSHELNSMNRPHERDNQSLVNYLEKHQPLLESERDFAYYKEDLVSLRPGRENAWLDAAVEAFLRWYPCSFVKKIFSTKEDLAKSSDPHIHYFSRTRINFVVTFLLTLIILLLLVAPIVGLFELTMKQNLQTTDTVCIGILLVSTLLFSSALSMFTKAKRHEVLAAAAAYCAVLVVFIGNIKGSRPN